MSAYYLPGTVFDAENGHPVKYRSDENELRNQGL